MVLMKDKQRIPILPNMITTGSIFAGFYSIMHSIHGDFTKAAWAIVIAGVCDNLDGRVARMTNSQSDFGVQYDSLSDMISFGFAPAMLAYFWGLESFGRIGWMASFIFVVCAALRLARFNVQGSTEEKDHFQGMPSPGAAGILLSTVLFIQEITGKGQIDNPVGKVFFLALVVVAALLMVSGVRFRTFKNFSIRGVSPLRVLLLGALILSLVMVSPEFFLFLVGITYLSGGIFETIFYLRKGVKEVLDPDEYKDTDENKPEGGVTLLSS